VPVVQLLRAIHLLLAMRCHAIVPGVATYGAIIGVRDQRRQHQPSLHRLRAIQHHAFVPEAVTSGYAAFASEAAPCLSRQLSSLTVLPSGQQASHLLRAMQSHAGVPEEVFLQCRRQRGQKGPAAPAGLTSRAGCDRLQRCLRPAAPAGRTSHCHAEQCHRPGCGHLRGCHQRVWQCKQHRRTFHLLRALQYPAVEPDVNAYSAAIRECEKGPAAPAGPYFSCVGCGATPSCRMWHLRCCQQRVRKGASSPQPASHLLRALQRHAIVPDGTAYSAALSASGNCQRHPQVCVSHGHYGALPSYRT